MSQNAIGILETISGEIERIAQRAGSSVVSVSSGRGGGGSGIAWDEHTVVTAFHVVRRADEVSVGTEDARKLASSVTGRAMRSDLAVLRVDEKLTPIQRADSDALRVGQFVLALANPFGARTSATSGIVTSAGRSVGGWWGMTIDDAVITDAKVNPGYSGGPLVDAAGRLIGMNVAYVSKRGIAVPVNTIAKIVERLQTGRPIRRAYIGVTSSQVAIPEEVSSRPDVGQESGAMILSVEKGTPASQAGIEFGDVVLRFGGRRVASPDDLAALLGDEETIGKTSDVSVLRGGKVVEFNVTPTAGKEGW